MNRTFICGGHIKKEKGTSLFTVTDLLALLKLELRHRRSVEQSVLMGCVWVWVVYCPWGFLTVYLFPEHGQYDNLVTRSLLGLALFLAYILFRLRSPSIGAFHWFLLLGAMAPMVQLIHFSYLARLSVYYTMGGLMVAGVATAIFTSVRVALVFICLNLILQAGLIFLTGIDRNNFILFLGHLTLHLLILATLVIRLRAMNFSLEQTERYRHQLEIAKGLSEATVHTAHDLKSPLSAISIISDRSKGDETSQLLKQALVSVFSLTNKLVELGKHVVSPSIERIDVKSANAILNFIGNLFRYGFSGKIEIILCNDDRRLNISSEGLERIASNLLKNSIEACSDSGEIVVKSSVENDHFKIEFSDNGPGIDPEKVRTILSRGFETSKVDGSGVGLQSVQYLVRDCGGTFQYSGREGGGAVFVVLLPFV